MRPLGAALAGTLAVAAVARAVPPPVVPWREADRHVGEIVTLEGVVAAVRTTGDAWILEFASDDAHAARVVLVVPLLSNLPRAPERLYVDRRIHASGLLRRFQGRPEMVLRNPAQLEVVDVAGPPGAPSSEPVARATPPSTAVAPPAAPPAPARTSEPPAAAPGAPAAPASAPKEQPGPVARAAEASSAPDAAAPGPPPTAPARALAEELARRVAAAAPCERAKARWRDAAGRAGDLANRLGRCVAEESYRCRVESAALAPALTDLEWAEQQVEEACR